MIPYSLNVHDDMRGQRLSESAFEKGDHRAKDTSRAGSAKAKVRSPASAQPPGRIAFVLLLLLTVLAGAEEKTPAEFKWRVLLEPMSMHREVSWEIPGAQRTVVAPVVIDGDDYLYPPKKILDRFHVDPAVIREIAAPAASADLASLQPRFERDRKLVIQYAELHSDRPIVASAVLAPKFLEMFKDTLGDKVLLVVPNRFTAYVFPALASNYQDYYPMVFEAYRATAWPVSVELFEVSAAGFRAAGLYQEP